MLFSLYFRQIEYYLQRYVKNLQFVDDIMIESTASYITIATAVLSVAATSFSGWISERGLQPSKQETHTILTLLRGVQLEPVNVVVSCCGQRLNVVTKVRYLGLLLDCGQTLAPHVSSLVRRSIRSVSALWKPRTSLTWT